MCAKSGNFSVYPFTRIAFRAAQLPRLESALKSVLLAAILVCPGFGCGAPESTTTPEATTLRQAAGEPADEVAAVALDEDVVVDVFTGRPIPGMKPLHVDVPPKPPVPRVSELVAPTPLEAIFDLLRRGVEHPAAPVRWRVTGLAPYATLHQAVAANDFYAVLDRVQGGADIHARDADGRTPLLVAAAENRPYIADQLLYHGADLADQDAFGNSVMHLAARASHIYTLENFHRRGAYIEARDQKNYTPMHAAAEAGDVWALHQLVRLGGDTHSLQDPDQLSIPAVIAARARQWEILRYFRGQGLYFSFHAMAAQGDEPGVIEALADMPEAIHLTDAVRNTPVLSAIYTGECEMLRLLLDRGGDKFAANQDGDTPIEAAIRYEHLECVRVLVEAGVGLNQYRTHGFERTLLNEAVRQSKAQMVAFLLENGADPNFADESGRTPLHVAVDMDDPEKVRLLIEKGASPSTPDGDGWPATVRAAGRGQMSTLEIIARVEGALQAIAVNGDSPLHAAAENGHAETAAWLVGQGASLEQRNKSGQTPLHLAASNGHAIASRVLLDSGASVDTPDGASLTPFLAAVVAGHAEVVELLLERGASRERSDGEHRNAIYLALEHRHTGLARKLHGLSVSVTPVDTAGRSAIFPAATAASVDTLAWLAGLGLDSNAVDANGVTPLHEAAVRGDFDTLTYLLDHGAAINAADEAGRTPFHRAAQRGNTTILELAFKHGADVAINDIAGRSALHFAAEAGRANAVRLLVAEGAALNHSDSQGATALFLAAKAGHYDALGELVHAGASVRVRTADGLRPRDAAVAAMEFAPDGGKSKNRTAYLRIRALLDAVVVEEYRAAASAGDEAVMDALLEVYPEFKDFMTFGRAPAHWAAQYGQTGILKRLHAQGVDLHAQAETEEGYAPLHIATQYDHPETVSWLLEAGVPAGLKSAQGETAGSIAARLGLEGMSALLAGK